MACNLAVAVAAHKPYWMPADEAYVPVWAGASLNAPAARVASPAAAGVDGIGATWRRDDEGVCQISDRNRSFCELTVLYWAWRNLDAAHVGLVHYRRHFARGPFAAGDRRNRVARASDLLERLQRAPVILPRERHYHIETNYSQYVHAHHEADLAAMRAILAERHPTYLAAYDACMARTHGHRFNMLVMRSDVLDAYCTWLFDVLFELERRLDTSTYSAYDARVFGFVSERLLDPWMETNAVPYTEMGVANLESQHWLRKGAAFLGRKVAAGKGFRG